MVRTDRKLTGFAPPPPGFDGRPGGLALCVTVSVSGL
jgi:hypothetical protein